MHPPHELILVGVSLASMAVLVHVCLEKEEARRKAAFLAGWLVPGLGHALMGRRRKGLFFFSILAATYLFGMTIVGFRPVAWDDNPFYYLGQYGCGATFVLARALSASKAVPQAGFPPSWFDPALLTVCVVGLLNLVVMANVLDLKAPGTAAGAEPAPPEAGA